MKVMLCLFSGDQTMPSQKVGVVIPTI